MSTMNFLTRSIAERAFDRIAVPRIPREPARVTEVIQQIEREFLAGPPLTLHLPVPAVLAGVWAALRESALAGPTDRAMREAIVSTVSLINKCPFCVDSHTAAMSALGTDPEAKAIRAGRLDAIRRDDIRAASRWAAATRSPGHSILAAPPFARADLPYAIGTALSFHYINRMVNAFLKPWPIVLPSFISRRGIMTRVNAVFPGRSLGAPNLEPGSSLQFCQKARRVPELAKLDEKPEVADGWAALVAAADDAGAAVLPAPVRTLIGEEIGAWDGSDPGLGSGRIHDAVRELREEERAAATFALTCAFAAYRVDDRLVTQVRIAYPTDRELVSIAAWASARATCRIASWL
jgi:AhpD family alkylhydroperoxidase